MSVKIDDLIPKQTKQSNQWTHNSVMKNECLDIFSKCLNKEGAVFVDGTLGLAGHSILMMNNFPNIKVIGIDRDQEAIAIATQNITENLNSSKDILNFISFHGNYSQIDQALEKANFTGADAILLDLGVSSMQLDNQDRGFSYTKDSAIDMRMNQNDQISAKDVINSSSVEDLTNIIKNYGEERYAKQIALSLKKHAEINKLNTTGDLADAIRMALPPKLKYDKQAGISSIKRVFQALRIAVNDELESLKNALKQCLDVLNVGGVIIVLSYHSLEDKIVKQFFQKAVGVKTDVELGLPFLPNQVLPAGDDEKTAVYKYLVQGSKKASATEIEHNSRAKSVRLRSLMRVK